jgi:hypothetical protein
MSAVKVIILGGIGTAVNIAEQMIDARERFGLKDEFIGFAFDNESFGSTINGFPLLCKTYDAFAKFGKHNEQRCFIPSTSLIAGSTISFILYRLWYAAPASASEMLYTLGVY